MRDQDRPRYEVVPKAIRAVYCYGGKLYETFHDYARYHDLWEGSWRHVHEDGNDSCDCNKSRFIQAQCDPAFPLLKCGNEIKTVELARVIPGE